MAQRAPIPYRTPQARVISPSVFLCRKRRKNPAPSSEGAEGGKPRCKRSTRSGDTTPQSFRLVNKPKSQLLLHRGAENRAPMAQHAPLPQRTSQPRVISPSVFLRRKAAQKSSSLLRGSRGRSRAVRRFYRGGSRGRCRGCHRFRGYDRLFKAAPLPLAARASANRSRTCGRRQLAFLAASATGGARKPNPSVLCFAKGKTKSTFPEGKAKRQRSARREPFGKIFCGYLL